MSATASFLAPLWYFFFNLF